MKRAAVVALAMTMIGVVAPARAEHSWSSFHWSRATNPMALTIVDSLTADWDAHLVAVVGDWNASSTIDLTTAEGDTSERARKRCQPVSGAIRACNASYGYNGWLGLASVWLSGDHIVQATTQVNDTYFALATYDDPIAKRHVLCQEVGHDFGLDHQYSEPTCMNDASGLHDIAYTSPGPHDYAHLDAIYSHLDAKSDTKTKPRSNNRHRHGHADVIRSTDDGMTLLTFVVHAS